MQMRRTLFRYHVWLGWLVGVPLLLWTVSGLVMVARPIETVRGADRKIDGPTLPLPGYNAAPMLNETDDRPTVKEIRTFMQRGRPITLVTRLDGSAARFDAARGSAIPALDEAEARDVVAKSIVGGRQIVGATLFAAKDAPPDFRKATPAWQVRLADGTHVYVGRDTGEIEAVRTRYWRFYDVMWGLHIMDLQTRENTHHPILIGFTIVSALASLLAILLMITRYFPRRRRPPTP